MALLFNLTKLEALAKGDPTLLRVVLKHFYDKAPPKASKRYTQYTRSELTGKSFLLHPEPILSDVSTDPAYVAQYIRLAARRSYMMYKVYNVRYLDLSAYPEVDIDQISHNPLLNIAQNKVYFKHEGN